MKYDYDNLRLATIGSLVDDVNAAMWYVTRRATEQIVASDTRDAISFASEVPLVGTLTPTKDALADSLWGISKAF